MDPKIVLIIVVSIVVVAAVAWAIARQRRTAALKSRFGPEYERTLREAGAPAKAETELLQRQKRVEKFRMRDLTAEERESYITEWRTVQSRFVDDPKRAVTDADDLVARLMQARGYPMSDFEQRAADISVDHPHVVDNYRAAHLIAVRQRRGEATTEDLRNAIIYYRSLFDELLQTPIRREVA